MVNVPRLSRRVPSDPSPFKVLVELCSGDNSDIYIMVRGNQSLSSTLLAQSLTRNTVPPPDPEFYVANNSWWRYQTPPTGQKARVRNAIRDFKNLSIELSL